MSRGAWMVGDVAALTSRAPQKHARRARYFEVWTCSNDGRVRKHGGAHGLTFQDACKHLACVSLDFWTHYDRDRYRGCLVYPSRAEAVRGQLAE